MSTAFYQPGLPRDWPQIKVLRRVWRAAAVLQDFHEPYFQRAGLSMLEFDVLSALGNTQGLRRKDLAHSMITTAPDVERICLDLQARGLVRCEPSPEADGEVMAVLTERGLELFEALFPETVNFSGRLLDTSLSHDELETLGRLLEKLLNGTHAPD